MNYFSNIDWLKVNSRWVSYFDLLGFGKRVHKGGWPEVVTVYSQCLDELAQSVGQRPKIGYCWFSDTFLLFADDDSAPCWQAIEQVSRFFTRNLVNKQIPVRGAISCGEFFADKVNQIFLGKALVEAHYCGERYNWIGLVLCPTAQERIKTFSQLPLGNYRNWDAEYKVGEVFKTESVWAYSLGAEIPSGGQNPLLGILRSMAERCSGQEVKRKYENTIHFLEQCGIWQRGEATGSRAKPTCATPSCS